MRVQALALIAGAALAACSTVPTGDPPDGLTSNGPAAVNGLDWHLTEDANETKLAYGRANSGDFGFALTCAPGSSRLSLFQAAEAGATVISLESGGDTEQFPAVSEPAGIQEGDVLVAVSPSKVPVFQRFRQLGWLATWQGHNREVLAAHPATRSTIERFFAVCG